MMTNPTYSFFFVHFQDSRRFIGINLDYIEEELNISEKVLERVHDFHFVRIDASFQPERLQPERLQLALQDLIYHSPKIRLLHWSYLKDICLPCTFNPEFLVELGMYASKLHKLWEGTKVSNFDENFQFPNFVFNI